MTAEMRKTGIDVVGDTLAQEGRHQTWRVQNAVTRFFTDERSDSHISGGGVWRTHTF